MPCLFNILGGNLDMKNWDPKKLGVIDEIEF